MSKRAFALVAHPDDIEFTMAGTLILLGRAGYELHYMTVASGCCGSMETDTATTAATRRAEAQAAAASIQAIYHESLADDLEIFYDRPTLRRMASIMREVAPEILLVQSPQDYMEDHMVASRLAVTAAFTRCIPNYPVDPPRGAVEQDVTVYHAQPHGNVGPLCEPIVPHIYIDITSVIDDKSNMLAQHASQKKWLDETQGMDSYLRTMRDMSRSMGQMSGRCEYAEGWRRHLHFGFCDEDADPLCDALADLVYRQD